MKKLWFYCAVVCVSVVGVYQLKAEAADKKQSPVLSATEKMHQDVADHLKKGEKDKAITVMEDIVASNEGVVEKEETVRELYKYAQETGKTQQVIDALKLKAAKNPDDVSLQRAIAEGHVRTKNWKELADTYEKINLKHPEDAAVRARLMDAYVLSGQADKTVDMLEPVVAANPGDNYNADILMNAYVKAGMKDKALALFKQRVDADPGSPGLRGRYAQALQDFGLLKESLKEWQAAAKLDPSNGFFQMKVNEVTGLLAA